MANRLVSNFYIIDSHQIALPLPMGFKDSAGLARCTTANNGQMMVSGFVFMPVDTTATITIAVQNTANIIMKYVAWGSGLIVQSGYPQVDHWEPVQMHNVFIPVITAATGAFILA